MYVYVCVCVMYVCMCVHVSNVYGVYIYVVCV